MDMKKCAAPGAWITLGVTRFIAMGERQKDRLILSVCLSVCLSIVGGVS